MTRLEYTEALQAVMPNIEIKIEGATPFLDFNIYYDFSNVKIKGKMPYDFAKLIESKYPCESLGIKAGSIGLSSCPDPFFKDDKYNYELNKPMPNESINSRSIRLNAERFKLSKRPNSQKYLETYRISSKEGLITILMELIAYYNKKDNEALEGDIKKGIHKANTQIIKSINPCITGAKWIGSTISFPLYYIGWCNTNSSSYNQELRRALDEFDRSVNPFMENDLSIEEITSDLSSLKMFISPFIIDNQNGQENYYKVTLTKESEKDSVSFGLNPCGFSYSGLFTLDDETYLSISHYFTLEKEEENSGEILSIEYFKTNSDYKKSICFNISKWTIGKAHESKKAPTNLEVAQIYLDLTQGTKLAADLTINNLTRNRVQK